MNKGKYTLSEGSGQWVQREAAQNWTLQPAVRSYDSPTTKDYEENRLASPLLYYLRALALVSLSAAIDLQRANRLWS